MKSISKYGKIFTGKFAETAIRIGIAKPIKEEERKVVKRTKKNK